MGTSYEVLGALVEVVSGTSLETFATREILVPLKMHDTYFYVPSEKQVRIPAPFTRSPDGKLQPIVQREERTEFYSGGGGLRSSVRDYFRFAQFLLNEGAL